MDSFSLYFVLCPANTHSDNLVFSIYNFLDDFLVRQMSCFKRRQTGRWAAGGGGEMIILKKRDRPKSIQDTNTNAICCISQEDPFWFNTTDCDLHRIHSHTMRPKARGLAQHGGPPGWLEGSDPAGCDFVRDGRSMPPALTDHTSCPVL
jgi:hypothetical protein